MPFCEPFLWHPEGKSELPDVLSVLSMLVFVLILHSSARMFLWVMWMSCLLTMVSSMLYHFFGNGLWLPKEVITFFDRFDGISTAALAAGGTSEFAALVGNWNPRATNLYTTGSLLAGVTWIVGVRTFDKETAGNDALRWGGVAVLLLANMAIIGWHTFEKNVPEVAKFLYLSGVGTMSFGAFAKITHDFFLLGCNQYWFWVHAAFHALMGIGAWLFLLSHEYTLKDLTRITNTRDGCAVRAYRL